MVVLRKAGMPQVVRDPLEHDTCFSTQQKLYTSRHLCKVGVEDVYLQETFPNSLRYCRDAYINTSCTSISPAHALWFHSWRERWDITLLESHPRNSLLVYVAQENLQVSFYGNKGRVRLREWQERFSCKSVILDNIPQSNGPWNNIEVWHSVNKPWVAN